MAMNNIVAEKKAQIAMKVHSIQLRSISYLNF